MIMGVRWVLIQTFVCTWICIEATGQGCVNLVEWRNLFQVFRILMLSIKQSDVGYSHSLKSESRYSNGLADLFLVGLSWHRSELLCLFLCAMFTRYYKTNGQFPIFSHKLGLYPLLGATPRLAPAIHWSSPKDSQSSLCYVCILSQPPQRCRKINS